MSIPYDLLHSFTGHDEFVVDPYADLLHARERYYDRLVDRIMEAYMPGGRWPQGALEMRPVKGAGPVPRLVGLDPLGRRSVYAHTKALRVFRKHFRRRAWGEHKLIVAAARVAGCVRDWKWQRKYLMSLPHITELARLLATRCSR